MEPVENSQDIPPFLHKLWDLVNDPNTNDLICWNSDGESFVIQNELEFRYELLPLYYKHNNMSSFVRQLNMYGFHKTAHFEGDVTDRDKIEHQYFHLYFRQHRPHLLINIKRKAPNTKIFNETQLNQVVDEVKSLHNRLSKVETVVTHLQSENLILKQKLAYAYQNEQTLQQAFTNILRLMLSAMQPSPLRCPSGGKRSNHFKMHDSPKKTQKLAEFLSESVNEMNGNRVVPENYNIYDRELEQFQQCQILKDSGYVCVEEREHVLNYKETTATNRGCSNSSGPVYLLDRVMGLNIPENQPEENSSVKINPSNSDITDFYNLLDDFPFVDDCSLKTE